MCCVTPSMRPGFSLSHKLRIGPPAPVHTKLKVVHFSKVSHTSKSPRKNFYPHANMNTIVFFLFSVQVYLKLVNDNIVKKFNNFRPLFMKVKI